MGLDHEAVGDRLPAQSQRGRDRVLLVDHVGLLGEPGQIRHGRKIVSQPLPAPGRTEDETRREPLHRRPGEGRHRAPVAARQIGGVVGLAVPLAAHVAAGGQAQRQLWIQFPARGPERPGQQVLAHRPDAVVGIETHLALGVEEPVLAAGGGHVQGERVVEGTQAGPALEALVADAGVRAGKTDGPRAAAVAPEVAGRGAGQPERRPLHLGLAEAPPLGEIGVLARRTMSSARSWKVWLWSRYS